MGGLYKHYFYPWASPGWRSPPERPTTDTFIQGTASLIIFIIHCICNLYWERTLWMQSTNIIGFWTTLVFHSCRSGGIQPSFPSPGFWYGCSRCEFHRLRHRPHRSDWNESLCLRNQCSWQSLLCSNTLTPAKVLTPVSLFFPFRF